MARLSTPLREHSPEPSTSKPSSADVDGPEASAAHPAIEVRPIAALRPYATNARVHSAKQVKQLANSIQQFGFTNPVLISNNDEIIAGHGRVAAARLLGLAEVPTLRLSHLSSKQRRAYMLADNKLALNAGWDRDILAIELQSLIDLEFDIELTGFSLAEIDLVLDEARESAGSITGSDRTDDIEVTDSEHNTTLRGDVWVLGRHRLICGDARSAEIYQNLLGSERADLIFTDPPYNVPIDGHVCGLGRVRHREFAMGVGEMSSEAFTEFLVGTLGPAAAVTRNGAIAYICMDWRHMGELLQAGKKVFAELKNVCVWNKTNAGMGSFYRSKHELIFVFKHGCDPHTNSFGLGGTGRYRTNVWDYAGVNTLRAGRDEELEMHPTVKPAALVADAIKDCSRRGDMVLDPFAGSGTTLIAAEMTGRRGRAIEYDPTYCDRAIRRYERLSGKRAIHALTKKSFEETAEERAVSVDVRGEQ